MLITDDRYLQHYGILGMHWGVRKDEAKGNKSQSSSIGKKFVLSAVGVGLLALGLNKARHSINNRRFMALLNKESVDRAKRAADFYNTLGPHGL